MRVAVLGVGLIGGSVALAARRRLGAHVTGWDPDLAAGREAELLGAIDEAAASLDAITADVWVVAAPVHALAQTVQRALDAASPDAVVTDVGSTKGAVTAAITDPRFIGGHPLAGAETAGVAHAREDLFDGATWYLTPRPDTDGERFERLHRFVSALGAAPTAIDPLEHDRVMAAVSHLPHIVANVLVAQAHSALGGEAMPATGPSFRDATRVAGANPPMWAQIYRENAAALGEQLDQAIARLMDARAHLQDLEADQLEARRQRVDLVEAATYGGPVTELRVAVPNRSGIVAELALAMSGAGISIADMSLAPSFDGSRGVVALWVPDPDAGRAQTLIEARDLTVER